MASTEYDAMPMNRPLLVDPPQRLWVPVIALLSAACLATPAAAATPEALQAQYTAQAGAPASAERGERFFTQRHGRDWSCATCHGAVPTATGKHAVTGKAIQPLAPAAHTQRFTDPAKVEKWFRRNCNDVVGRECSAAEKADVIAWLQTLKP
jgi:Domain of unknown function (DUF1924)